MYSFVGGNIAASWVAMKALGKEGFLKIAQDTMNVTMKLCRAIEEMDDLALVAQPHMTAFAVKSVNPKVAPNLFQNYLFLFFSPYFFLYLFVFFKFMYI